MKDRFGREVLGLRISVTERCNLRCFYCHKEGCQPTEDEISAEEIGMIAAVATSLGIKKFKLTGGEPLLRNDLAEIIRKISQHKVDDLALTTNGVMLAQMADELAESGLMRVNISLDTLDREKFKRITGADALEDVLRGIKAAAEAGLKPVKINMVLLAGINENEVEKMISFAAEHDAVLQLIELIDLNGRDFDVYHKCLEEIERKLESRAISIQTRSSMHARKRYLLPEGEVEVVRPMHNSEFCAHCTRLRLTSDGKLKPCLMRNDNLVDVRKFLSSQDVEEARSLFLQAIDKREPFFRAMPFTCSKS